MNRPPIAEAVKMLRLQDMVAGAGADDAETAAVIGLGLALVYDLLDDLQQIRESLMAIAENVAIAGHGTSAEELEKRLDAATGLLRRWDVSPDTEEQAEQLDDEIHVFLSGGNLSGVEPFPAGHRARMARPGPGEVLSEDLGK